MKFVRVIQKLAPATALLLFCALNQSGRGVSPSPDGASGVFSNKLDRLAQHVHRREYRAGIDEGQTLLLQIQLVNRPYNELQVRRYLGGAQLGDGRYLDALHTLLPARDLAIRLNDAKNLDAIDNNLAWIYMEMNNLEAAADLADQALAVERRAGKYDARPVILRGFVFAKCGDLPHAERAFTAAINHALDDGDLVSAAAGWHLLGASYVDARLFPQAKWAETEAFRLRKTHHLPDLDQSLRDLGTVLAETGDLRTATVLMDEALSAMGDPASTAPVWYFYRARGQLRRLKGDLDGALPDLRIALDLARRVQVIPTDDDRVTFESGLAELYSLFIDTGNRLYLQSRNPSLQAEMFEASEENRAASLRAIVPQPNGWRTRLPPEHGETLARLQAAERSVLLHGDAQSETQTRLLRISLDQIEAHAGADPNLPGASALRMAKEALDDQTAVLAFQLGQDSSWVWAITSQSFDLYRLAPKAAIAQSVESFRRAILDDHSAGDPGADIGRQLLGCLPAAVHAKHRWIIALDRELFDLPLAAVRWNGRYLIEDHALLLTPGVRLLEPVAEQSALKGRLAALGDPIYNRADARWAHRPFQLGLFRNFSSEGLPLARLSGTGSEVRVALEAWGEGSVITGAEATKKTFKALLDTEPAILHLATHVIRSPHQERSGIIVLGLNVYGEPEFLDMREILLRPVNVRLVVMSGCASGDAVALPATGLMGLTRAWLAAGAQDVLATRWPSMDDNGRFFVSFYQNLRKTGVAGAAEALHLAQVAMIQSHSFRDRPAYWASYFLIGKV